ncbi:hypothetical protein ACIPVK_18750 [Paeniglutamicibacter sp. MACA_103]|uniref:hypothetical protein n=1 Tax=Paeniglutamicibacter sp. MACA_103 TaxID=3377337 RepID=UPI003895181E
MSVITLNAASTSTARMDFHEMVNELNKALGATLVTSMAGYTDRSNAYKWAKAGSAEPKPQAVTRLRFAHSMLTYLCDNESIHVARAWFMGANPWLNYDTPIDAIREDNRKQVAAAAEALVLDSHAA